MHESGSHPALRWAIILIKRWGQASERFELSPRSAVDIELLASRRSTRYMSGSRRE
ncbi:hypothetical protein [Nocardia sp. NPDC058114]|uniref:hypothetical protein n=1 Tax=Nocardia sp. NPDC058114 TaxID=3346346 RepID=UPI0036DDFA1E